MRLLGLDPGLRSTGWGLIEVRGNRLSHVANGSVRSEAETDLPRRLVQLHDGLKAIIEQYRPDWAAVEETFVNKNPGSTLKLGQARAIALLVPAQAGIAIAEYSPNLIKKSVVGGGHAEKEQIHAMVRVLLPGVAISGPDAADALAVAICHAHHAASRERWAGGRVLAGAAP
ncbi:MAG: crossover junction endodeoxyribonuclease RuvC [Alphaproteobacteria bacterium]|nr:crossover junction endodeoxyribonuclease RuvC [Alphaproteobacteria bacterium]